MSEALIGSNQFYEVPFPISIGNRYIHVAQRPDGSMAIQAFRWHPGTRTVEEEALGQSSHDAPLTIVPAGGGGGVRLVVQPEAIEGYATSGSEAAPYTIIFRSDSITIMRGDTTVAAFRDNTITGAEVGISVDADGVSLGGSLPEAFVYRVVHRDEDVVLSSLVTAERPVIQRHRFVGCRIHGPAILAAVGPLAIVDNRFDMAGASTESIVWEMRPDQAPYGAILVSEVEFEGNDFLGVAFAIPAGGLEHFLAAFAT